MARRGILVGAVAAGLLAVNAAGLPYYMASQAERMRHPLRPYFKPSGLVGQTLGLAALSLFLFLWLYPIRKRIPFLANIGQLPRWLDLHIVAGLLVPPLAAMHATWRFAGLIGLGYGSMFVVAVSGIVGRYLYTHIPRGRSGLELSRGEASAERRLILGDLCVATGLTPAELEQALAPEGMAAGGGILATVGRMISDDFARRRAVHRLTARLGAGGAAPADRAKLRKVGELARREMALGQQLRMLEGIQKVFKFWHAAHFPFAITALLAVLIHVAVAIAVGQTWFW